MLPLFKKVEDYQHGADEMHGVGGELRVEESRVRWEILEAWRDAAEECGIPKIREFNRGDNFGSAYFQMNQTPRRALERDEGVSPAGAVAAEPHRRHQRAGGTGAHRPSDGVLRAEGVEFVDQRARANASREARRETILAAGSIGSPQLLQLSGVGPAGLLAAHGITPCTICRASARTCTTICRSACSTRSATRSR